MRYGKNQLSLLEKVMKTHQPDPGIKFLYRQAAFRFNERKKSQIFQKHFEQELHEP